MDNTSYNIRVPKRWARVTMIVSVTALIVAPLTALATHTFNDVPDTNNFHADIEWLEASGVTRGCNPPANTLFCPDDSVTRGQMAAFMNRFAGYLGAEDGTPATADHATTAGDAGTLDGLSASELITAGPGLATASVDDGTSTSSLTYVDVPGMSKQVVVPPGESRDALIAFSAVVDCTQNPVLSVWCFVRVQVDGATVWEGQFSSVQHGPNSISILGEGAHSLQAFATGLAPGSHTVNVQYRVDEPNSGHQLRDKRLSVMTFSTSVTDLSASGSDNATDDEK